MHVHKLTGFNSRILIVLSLFLSFFLQAPYVKSILTRSQSFNQCSVCTIPLSNIANQSIQMIQRSSSTKVLPCLQGAPGLRIARAADAVRSPSFHSLDSGLANAWLGTDYLLDPASSGDCMQVMKRGTEHKSIQYACGTFDRMGTTGLHCVRQLGFMVLKHCCSRHELPGTYM